jgi:hypothetical protein
MYLTILFHFSLLLVRFLVRLFFGVGLGGVSGSRVHLLVAGSGMGRLCVGESLGVSTALCPPG